MKKFDAVFVLPEEPWADLTESQLEGRGLEGGPGLGCQGPRGSSSTQDCAGGSCQARAGLRAVRSQGTGAGRLVVGRGGLGLP